MSGRVMGKDSARNSPSPPPLKRKRKFESTTTNKAIASFFTPASKKEPDPITWRTIDSSLLVGRYKPNDEFSDYSKQYKKRRKIAAFDFDSTLIQTSSGNVFGKDAADWRWWHPCVPGILRGLYSEGYLVVILSNQGGLSLKEDPKTIKSDLSRLTQFKIKAAAVFKHLGIPISLYAATSRDHYRKPRTGMWTELLEEHDLDVNEGPELKDSIFVGDAAGRPPRKGSKADHSSSDRDFASNVRINFQTPEEYFLNEASQPFQRTFNPQDYIEIISPSPTSNTLVWPQLSKWTRPEDTLAEYSKVNDLDIVIFCGSPGAGKSTYYWKRLQPLGYERVNQDTLKTREKCLKTASEFLSSKQSVVVDNTNVNPATRTHWVQLSRIFGVPIRCIYFTAPIRLCEHNDTVRALNTGLLNPEKRTILPHSAFSAYASRFVEPTTEEGFQDVTRIMFQASEKVIHRGA